MDIHKPKPWQGWPEFVKEIGTIVIGVLIALGAEQGVEWLHWRHLEAQTEENLRTGATANLEFAMIRLASLPCVNARVLELSRALGADGADWRATTTGIPFTKRYRPALPQVVREPKGFYSHTPWDNAVAQGAVSHLGRTERALFARSFRGSAIIEELQVEEADLESRLGVLAFDGSLTREQRAGLLTVVSQLDSVEARIASHNERLLLDAPKLGLKPAKLAYDDIATLRSQRGACVRDIAFPLSPVSPDPL